MYKKTNSKWLKHIDFIILDCLCLEFSFFLAYFIRHDNFDLIKNSVYRNMIIVLLLLEVVVLYFNESFKNVLKRGYYKEFSMTIRHLFLLMASSSLYLFFTQMGNDVSRITLFLTYFIYLLICYPSKLIWKWYILKKAKDEPSLSVRSLVVIVSEDKLEESLNNIQNYNFERFSISGICILDRNRAGDIIQGVPVIGNSETIIDIICRQWVDEVFINLSSFHPLYDNLIKKFIEMGITVHLKLDHTEHFGEQKQFVEKLGSYTVLTTSINVASNRQLLLKRIMDVIGGVVGCMLTLVLIIFVGPFIYLQDPGPIFYTQVRVGKNGKRFNMVKFRSMILNADDLKEKLKQENIVKDGMMFKVVNDPRIIGGSNGIGNFIRKTSLDEFPQFWNVLKGEMSLVGTRPPTIDEWEKYDAHHRARLAVKPGITGLWQVSGRSNITDFEEVVKLDTRYITEWSMGLDFRILFKTILVVCGKKGAV